MFDQLASAEWLATQLSWQQPSLWLAGDLLLGLLWFAGLRWLLRQQPITGWWSRCLLIPYVGLLAGGVSPTRMGLQDVDWGLSLRTGGMITLLILVLLALVRGMIVAYQPAPTLSDEALATQRLLLSPGWLATLQIFLLSGAWEFHWCFWRSALTELLLALPEASPEASYWALWMASLCMLPEIAITTRLRPASFALAVCLVATSLVFLFTSNFWLCWLLHFAIRLSLAWLDEESAAGRQAQRPAAQP